MRSNLPSELLCLCLCLALGLWTGLAADCPYQDLVNDGQTHTMCLPPNATCKILYQGVGTQDQAYIVKYLNTIRERVASGKQTVAAGVVLPPAGNMRQLQWNDELARIAQAHANQCGLNFDCLQCRSTEEYETGETIYFKYGNGGSRRMKWDEPLNYWYTTSSEMTSIKAGDRRPTTFAQMIWGTTKDIGCGYASINAMYRPKGVLYRYAEYVVCIYGPAGNFPDRDVYEAGEPCSDCEYNDPTCCGSTCKAAGVAADYPSLCKSIPAKAG